MGEEIFDIIVIGSGSGGLSVGLFMATAGFKVLMVSISDNDIGGDCLNDGCVPSKALIHVSRLVHNARKAVNFGLKVHGEVDIQKALNYVYERQELIRDHENARWLTEQGVDVALGYAHFTGTNEIEVEGKRYRGKRIVIATGSKPKRLEVAGVDLVRYYDNENIFKASQLPQRLLVIGGGPIGMEISQAMSRLGSSVTVVQHGQHILPGDDVAVTEVLASQLKKEGIKIITSASISQFASATSAVIKMADGQEQTIEFDAVFVGIGRTLHLDTLQLNNAGIEVKDGHIVRNQYLRTTNRQVFVCGDVAGDLKFSHVAEFHARIILNNLFSPLNKKLRNDHLSWVTFTDPEVATFGLNEPQLKKKGIAYLRLEEGFSGDDRAVTDAYQYAKLVIFISKKTLLRTQKILGGTMVAPGAGELIQELILANAEGLSINAIFNKIYPYPVASRINQKLIVSYKSQGITSLVKKLLHTAFKIFS